MQNPDLPVLKMVLATSFALSKMAARDATKDQVTTHQVGHDTQFEKN